MSEIMTHLSEHSKNLIDTASFAVVIGTITNVLPTLAVLLSIIWTGIRISEWAVLRGARLCRFVKRMRSASK